MRNKTRSKERCFPTTSPIDILIDQNELPRRQLLFQRSDRAKCQDAIDTRTFQSVDVGAVVDVRRRNAMTAPMPRQKRDADTLKSPDQQIVRCLTERRINRHPLCISKSLQVIQTGATDDAYRRYLSFSQSHTPPSRCSNRSNRSLLES